MSDDTTTIDITPTWKAAAQAYVMLIENGTEEGKREARKGILAMGAALDRPTLVLNRNDGQGYNVFLGDAEMCEVIEAIEELVGSARFPQVTHERQQHMADKLAEAREGAAVEPTRERLGR